MENCLLLCGPSAHSPADHHFDQIFFFGHFIYSHQRVNLVQIYVKKNDNFPFVRINRLRASLPHSPGCDDSLYWLNSHSQNFRYYIWSKNASGHLPITVKLSFRFLVGELRKSTRHRYIPSSANWMLSTFRCAGALAVLKNARDPNTVGDDHSFACPNCRLRTSKLKNKNENPN